MRRRRGDPFHRAGRLLGALVAPPRCLACRALAPGPPPEGLCAPCRAELARPAPRPAPLPGIAAVRGVCPYAGAAVGLVARVKSGAVPAAAETVAELCAERLGPIDRGAAIVPVPASPLRALRRGDDPALAIARALAGGGGLTLSPVLVRRDRGRQRGRDRRSRLARPPRIELAGPAPGRCLLVDDVLTTGATLAAAAAALRGGGTARVEALAFAITPPPGQSA